MKSATFRQLAILLTGFLMVTTGHPSATPAADDKQPGDERVFELRTYTARPGKLDALNTRFREHTNRLFQKHGMELIGYWMPADGPESENTLIYILAFPSREAREKSWEGFRSDPEWHKARDASEKDGPILEQGGVQSKLLNPTDYSPIK